MSKRKHGSLGSGILERLKIAKSLPVNKATRNSVDFGLPPKKHKKKNTVSLLTSIPVEESPKKKIFKKEDEVTRKACGNRHKLSHQKSKSNN